MIGTTERQDFYVSRFERLERERPAGSAWLRSLQKGAISRFAELGFPTTHNEDWKYTSAGPIAKTPFAPAERDGHRIRRKQLPDAGCRIRMVFVNGFYAPELSTLSALPPGVRVVSIAAALAAGDEKLESHLACYAQYDGHAFVALNTAFLSDGALIEIPRGMHVEEPVHVLFATVPGGEPAVSHPRCLILAGRGSQAAVVEEYTSLGEGSYFTNAVTEIVAEEGAVLEHVKLQLESPEAFHVATVQGIQERNSVFNSHNLSFGGALVRNDVNSVLDAEGAECVLNGLFVAGARQHVDNHTTLDHAKPHCNSRELYKGILAGDATGVFNGKILVRKDAQKTNAIQSNKNLLLSENAVVNTKPQLEIYADDVRCTHGATVGQLDAEALFYMQSRGIERTAARDLLTYAFAADILDRMTVNSFRGRLEETLYRKLSAGRQGGTR